MHNTDMKKKIISLSVALLITGLVIIFFPKLYVEKDSFHEYCREFVIPKKCIGIRKVVPSSNECSVTHACFGLLVN